MQGDPCGVSDHAPQGVISFVFPFPPLSGFAMKYFEGLSPPHLSRPACANHRGCVDFGPVLIPVPYFFFHADLEPSSVAAPQPGPVDDRVAALSFWLQTQIFVFLEVLLGQDLVTDPPHLCKSFFPPHQLRSLPPSHPTLPSFVFFVSLAGFLFPFAP